MGGPWLPFLPSLGAWRTSTFRFRGGIPPALAINTSRKWTGGSADVHKQTLGTLPGTAVGNTSVHRSCITKCCTRRAAALRHMPSTARSALAAPACHSRTAPTAPRPPAPGSAPAVAQGRRQAYKASCTAMQPPHRAAAKHACGSGQHKVPLQAPLAQLTRSSLNLCSIMRGPTPPRHSTVCTLSGMITWTTRPGTQACRSDHHTLRTWQQRGRGQTAGGRQSHIFGRRVEAEEVHFWRHT